MIAYMPDILRTLEAAHAYLQLGLPEDAWHELEALPALARAAPRVIELRIEVLQMLEKWESARGLAESMANRSPENPDWWIQWAYCLRREQSVTAARDVLIKAVQIHPTAALIVYDLACYATLLGELTGARALLKRAFALQPNLRKLALADPDLEAILGVTTTAST